MPRLCVFCGSSPGDNPAYRAAAQTLGQALVEQGLGLVYGGAAVGLMGVVADAALAAGGEVIGILTEGLQRREVGHPGLTELRIVETMHQRKAMMADLADGFIALPGGIGTLDEFCEILTWSQLGIHTKPCGLLNIAGYYDALIAFFDQMVASRFLSQTDRERVLVEDDAAQLLARFAAYRSQPTNKWLDRTQV